MLLTQIIRQLFHFIDSNLYNFIPVMYDLIISISRTSVLSQAQIKEFADRIQVILGAFMLFKVSISLILYIVNPDDFSDKSKGFGKLWLNIIISLLLLVGTPYIFSLAYQFQTKVLEDDSLAELIMGESDENVSYIYTAGDKIAFRVMLPFFTPNSSIPSLESCANLINANGQLTDECYQDMLNLKTGKDTAVSSTIVGNYKWGVDYGSLGLTFRLDTAKQIVKGSDGNEYFLIDYKAGISTVAAVIVLLVLTTFCMDVALRSIKLAFLQLIAPIPIISYIDPKSGKDGMFKKWYEMAFKTYLSLFIRLIALYFGIYIISKTTGMYDSVTGASVNNFTIQLFIIIGVLMFVKQLPKILEGIGIKLDGDGKFNLNPFRKFEQDAAPSFLQKRLENFRGNLYKDGYGIGLGAKKIISGIDSARAGKGFWNGTRKVEGNGIIAHTTKWYRDLTPNHTEMIKKSREAQADLNYKRKLYFEGKERAKQMSTIDPTQTIKEHIKSKKQDMTQLFVNGDGTPARAINKSVLEDRYNKLGKALVEQYGGDTPKNREYARIAVEKHQAETEMRRLNALQREAYNPTTGQFVATNIAGAMTLSGDALTSAEALEEAIETQRKILESVSEYATKEKEFQYKNGAIDSAVSTAKGLEPRNRNPFA